MSSLRRHVSRGVYQFLNASGAARLHRRSQAVVFCYHNVIPDALANQVGDPAIHLPVSSFSEQLDWITRSFTVVSIDELATRLREGASVAGLAALTFDDGYYGVVHHAIPLMRAAGVPFALFPVVEGASRRRPFWWDLFPNLTADQRDRFLSELKGDFDAIAPFSNASRDLPTDAIAADWVTLRRVSGADCTIGVHTVTHRNLSMLTETEIAWELNESRERITTELGQTPTIVAYPYGFGDAKVQKVTEAQGFEAGCTLSFNLVRQGNSTFDIPRINIPAGIPMANFACWSSGLKLGA
jgi:peptidoglycan/xylan/chitin deacetylase (PgdA/CDA1 family)